MGRNIRLQRRRQNMTQEALALKAGMHVHEVSRAERGIRDMRVSTVARIAAGLDVPAMELLRDV